MTIRYVRTGATRATCFADDMVNGTFTRVLACGSRVARRPWGISIIIINIIIDTVICIIMMIRMPSDIAIASAILKLTQ